MSQSESVPDPIDVVAEEVPDEEAPAHREVDPEAPVLGGPDPEAVVDDPRPKPEDDVPGSPRLVD